MNRFQNQALDLQAPLQKSKVSWLFFFIKGPPSSPLELRWFRPQSIIPKRKVVLPLKALKLRTR
jgi:hypothetical protein